MEDSAKRLIVVEPDTPTVDFESLTLLRLHYALPYAKDLVRTYGDVISIDATHGTNLHMLPCFSITVEDCNSNSHVVVCSVFTTENKQAIQSSLQFGKDFLDMNPQTVMADKDMAEAGAVKCVFPSADSILCRYHVVDYLRKMVNHYLREADCDLKKQALALIDEMVYAQTLQAMERLVTELESRIAHIPAVPPFGAIFREGVELRKVTLMDYLRKNWLYDKGGAWALYEIEGFVLNGKTTNNGNEAHHSKLKKEDITRKTSLVALAKTVIKLQKRIMRKLRDNSGKAIIIYRTMKLPSTDHASSSSVHSSPNDERDFFPLLSKCVWLGKKLSSKVVSYADHARTLTGRSSYKVSIIPGTDSTVHRTSVSLGDDGKVHDVTVFWSNSTRMDMSHDISDVSCSCVSFKKWSRLPCCHVICTLLELYYTLYGKSCISFLPFTEKLVPRRASILVAYDLAKQAMALCGSPSVDGLDVTASVPIVTRHRQLAESVATAVVTLDKSVDTIERIVTQAVRPIAYDIASVVRRNRETKRNDPGLPLRFAATMQCVEELNKAIREEPMPVFDMSVYGPTPTVNLESTSRSAGCPSQIDVGHDAVPTVQPNLGADRAMFSEAVNTASVPIGSQPGPKKVPKKKRARAKVLSSHAALDEVRSREIEARASKKQRLETGVGINAQVVPGDITAAIDNPNE